MARFIKAQAASVVATLVDYAITIICREILQVWFVWASALGTLCGGIVHFSLGRRWVFSARHKELKGQMGKYIIVWIGYILLSTGAVYVLTRYASLNYILSKILVSVLMGVGYNYTLHKRFVFNH
jgi:putative flippase GtrA